MASPASDHNHQTTQMTPTATHHTDGTPPNKDKGQPCDARIWEGLHGSPDDRWVAMSPTRQTMPVPPSSTVSTGTPPSVDPPLTQPITPTHGEGRGAAWPMRTTHHQGARGRRGTEVLLSTCGLTTTTSRLGTTVRGPDHYPTSPTAATMITTATSRRKTLAGMYLHPRAP